MFIITTKSAINGVESQYIESNLDAARLTYYRHLNQRHYQWVTLVDVIEHWSKPTPVETESVEN
jgi:hypothetical protein